MEEIKLGDLVYFMHNNKVEHRRIRKIVTEEVLPPLPSGVLGKRTFYFSKGVITDSDYIWRDSNGVDVTRLSSQCYKTLEEIIEALKIGS